MAPYFSVTGSRYVPRDCTIILAFFWISGLFGGFFYFRSAANISASLMRGYFDLPVSIVRLLAVELFPCVISAAAAALSAYWLFVLLSFIKAFSFSFVSLCFLNAFGTSGWLICLLAMAGDFLMLPLYFCFWLRVLRGDSCSHLWPVILLFCGCFLACSVDLFVITPFLASLFD